MSKEEQQKMHAAVTAEMGWDKIQPDLLADIKREGYVSKREEQWYIHYVLEDDGTISLLNDLGGGVVRYDAEGKYLRGEHIDRDYTGKGTKIIWRIKSEYKQMPVRMDKYRVGDTVEWRDADTVKFMVEHGPGPFTIKNIHEVEFVDYGKAGYDLEEVGNTTSWESVGHTQHLVLETQQGESVFSGAWFKPLR